MKRLNIAIVLLAIINIVLTVVFLNKTGVINRISSGLISEERKPSTQKVKAKESDSDPKIYTYGCKVCKKGEELVVKGIHVKVNDAYFTKNTKGLTILYDGFDLKDGMIVDDNWFLVVDAEVWSERTDEGLDWFRCALNKRGHVEIVGEIAGSSWLEPLTQKQKDSSMVYIKGRYLPPKAEKMNIVFAVNGDLIPDGVENSDMLFEINTSGGQLGSTDNAKELAGFVNLGKVEQR